MLFLIEGKLWNGKTTFKHKYVYLKMLESSYLNQWVKKQLLKSDMGQYSIHHCSVKLTI